MFLTIGVEIIFEYCVLPENQKPIFMKNIKQCQGETDVLIKNALICERLDFHLEIN